MGELLYDLQFKYIAGDHAGLLITRETGIKQEDLLSVQVGMLSSHCLEGHVQLSLEAFNLDLNLHYELKGLRPLVNHIKARDIQAVAVRKYYWQILSILSSSNRYMLDSDRYVLDLSYIYIDSETEKISLVYLPLQAIQGKNRLVDELKTLFIDLFKAAQGVELHFYNQIIDYLRKTDFQLLTLMSLVEKTSVNEKTGQEAASIEQAETLAKQKKRFNWFSKSKGPAGESDSRKKMKTAHKEGISDDQLWSTRKLVDDAPILTLERRSKSHRENIVMEQEHFIIGRNKGVAHYFESSKDVSRVHLELIRDATGFLVKDLDSKNGSYLNGEKLTPNKLYPIVAGDLIQIIGIEYYVKNIVDKEGEKVE